MPSAIPAQLTKKIRYYSNMDNWHGFMQARYVSQVYETTIADSESSLSAHFITVPARALGGRSYQFQGSEGPLESLGLLRLADVPLGMTARSLAACLVSEDADDFLQRFHGSFKEEAVHTSINLPEHFEFAEYLTFARRVPFEDDSLYADSLGNILTGQLHGEAAYMCYEDTNTPVLAVAIPSGILICGSTAQVVKALEAGMRQQLMEFVKSRSGGE